MMILRSSPASPFGRKVRIAAGVLGLADKIDVRATDTAVPDDDLLTDNPLGKIPVLVLDDGTSVYDSRVILEYLDHLAGGGRILPRDLNARFAALRLQALADGILDAMLLVVYEGRYRPGDMKVQVWIDRQNEKVARGLAMLEAAAPALSSPPDVGQISLACAFGYADLRFAGAWREKYPKLVAWLDRFAAQVPEFELTRPPA